MPDIPEEFDHLPDVLRHVAERLNRAAAMNLAASLGGEEVKIPERAQGSVLESRVGIEIATVLVEEWAGIRIAIPNNRALVARERARLVLAQPGKGANRLARELGITARQVRNIRSAARHRKQQIDRKRSA